MDLLVLAGTIGVFFLGSDSSSKAAYKHASAFRVGSSSYAGMAWVFYWSSLADWPGANVDYVWPLYDFHVDSLASSLDNV